MKIRPFQAVYPNFDFITSTDSFFANVKYDYPEYYESGFFKKASQEAIYIYRITTQKHSFTGIIACSDLQDYYDGKIKKHENTLSSKEQMQMQLMIRRGAMVKPVLLTYQDVKEVNTWIRKHIKKNECFFEAHFEKEAQTHSFWEVSDGKAIQTLQNLFDQNVGESYIADGHHRTSTAALLYERLQHKEKDKKYDQLLSAYFPVSELEVHDYNRIVEGLNECSLTTFMAKMSKIFDFEILEEGRKPTEKHEIVMYLNREWFALRWKKSVLKSYKQFKVVLDASMLDEKVLKDILGIKDIRTDLRIKYVEGTKGVEEVRTKTIKNENRIAFLLYPVKLEELIAVADANMIMPPKSTWFEPRMRNGLLVQEY